MNHIPLRKGVILTEVCGEYMLVATESARMYCPFAKRINETAAFYWHLMKKGYSISQIEQEAVNEYEGVSRSEIRKGLKEYLYSLKKNGYLEDEPAQEEAMNE